MTKKTNVYVVIMFKIFFFKIKTTNFMGWASSNKNKTLQNSGLKLNLIWLVLVCSLSEVIT